MLQNRVILSRGIQQFIDSSKTAHNVLFFLSFNRTIDVLRRDM